jgi:hypothetical protein
MPLMPPPVPSREQLGLFALAIRLFEKSRATLIGKMQPDGSLMLSVIDNGTTTQARFGRTGAIIEGWF